MTAPYFQADGITLFHGDCLEILDWQCADILLTDPPYGRGWSQTYQSRNGGTVSHPDGIIGDTGTSVRDAMLTLWGTERPGYVFTDYRCIPSGTKNALIWQKNPDRGFFGAVGGWRRDWEMICLVGRWEPNPARASGVIRSGEEPKESNNPGRHPHMKPTVLLEQLLTPAPEGVVADPFAGSGSTLLAARHAGRQAVGVEIEERWCERAARRLAQEVIFV